MICRFEGFELHEERRELRRGAQRLGLPRKSFELLRYLLYHAGRVVSKEEILASLWPGEHVSDAVLPVNMRTIRKTLGESKERAVIRTVRGCGYGIACPVDWLESPRAPQPPGRIGEPPFVGRAALMDELETQLECALDGQGCSVLLYGDAGVGKTRVLEAFVRRACARPLVVLHARAERNAGAPPYWTLLELLDSAQRALLREPFRALLERAGFDLEAAHARVRSLFSASNTRGLDPDLVRFRLARSTVQHIEAISRIAPVALVLDDLHCLDEGSLRVCAALIRQIHQRSLLFLGAYREDDLQPADPLSQTLGALATERALRQLPLRGLNENAVGELFVAEAGFEPEPALRRSLHAWTEGNPFFLRELLRLLAAEDRLRPGACADLSRVGLPRASRDILERRLQLVSPACREVLVWAAVIGRRFAFPLLEQVAPCSGTRLLEQLREAAQARILDGEPHLGGEAPPLGEYCFAHALVREAIYTRLSAPERVLRHRAVGEALARLRCSPPGSHLLELAHHFFEAAPGGDIDRAVEYCVSAGRHALLVFAYEEAVRQFSHALRAEELRSPAAPLRICCALLALGDALRRARRYEESRDVFQRAAQLARELGRADLLAYSALGLAKWPRFVGPKLPFKLAPAATREQRDEALALVDVALRACEASGEDGPHLPLRARLIAVRARAEIRLGHRARAAAQSERALALARRSGDRRAVFDALLAQRGSLCTPQDAAQALGTASELMAVALELGAEPLLFAACESRIAVLLALGDIPGADADIELAHEIALRLRTPVYEYSAVRLRVARLLGDGQLELARPLLTRLKCLGRSAGDANARWSYNSIGMWMLYLEGRTDLVRKRVEAIFEGGAVQACGTHLFAADYWRSVGEKRRCREHFDIAAARDFSDLEIDSDWLWTLWSGVQVCAYLGDRRRARLLYAMISPHAELNVTNALSVYRGSAQLPLGCLSQLLGDRPRACAQFEAALAFNKRIGAHTARLFAQTHYGRALLQGSREEQKLGGQLLLEVERQAAPLGLGRLRHASQLCAEV